MKFFTQYERPPRQFEAGGGPCDVETAGYVPADVQIMDLINAGRRLDAFRKERYDFESLDKVPKDYYDPTRSPGFDMAEASQIQLATAAKLREQAAQASVEQQKPVVSVGDDNQVADTEGVK